MARERKGAVSKCQSLAFKIYKYIVIISAISANLNIT
jgi:hypothetical protein